MPSLSIYRMPHSKLIILLRVAFSNIRPKMRALEMKWVSQAKATLPRQGANVHAGRDKKVSQFVSRSPLLPSTSPRKGNLVSKRERDSIWDESEAEMQRLQVAASSGAALHAEKFSRDRIPSRSTLRSLPLPFSSASSPTQQSPIPSPRIQITKTPFGLRLPPGELLSEPTSGPPSTFAEISGGSGAVKAGSSVGPVAAGMVCGSFLRQPISAYPRRRMISR
jgi:hypothetical protein